MTSAMTAAARAVALVVEAAVTAVTVAKATRVNRVDGWGRPWVAARRWVS